MSERPLEGDVEDRETGRPVARGRDGGPAVPAATRRARERAEVARLQVAALTAGLVMKHEHTELLATLEAERARVRALEAREERFILSSGGEAGRLSAELRHMTSDRDKWRSRAIKYRKSAEKGDDGSLGTTIAAGLNIAQQLVGMFHGELVQREARGLAEEVYRVHGRDALLAFVEALAQESSRLLTAGEGQP